MPLYLKSIILQHRPIYFAKIECATLQNDTECKRNAKSFIYSMLSSISCVYKDKFTILQHVLKLSALDTRTCFKSSTVHLTDASCDALLNAAVRNVSLTLSQNIAVMLNNVSNFQSTTWCL